MPIHNRKIICWLIITFVALVSCFTFIVTYPRDIIGEKDNGVTVVIAEYNAGYDNGNANYIDISDKSNEIISILVKYKERMSFVVANGYNFADVQFRIILDYGGGCKEILLGNNSYSYMGVGKFKHTIVNDDNLLEELRKLIK